MYVFQALGHLFLPIAIIIVINGYIASYLIIMSKYWIFIYVAVQLINNLCIFTYTQKWRGYTAKNVVLIISSSILNFNITASAEYETIRIKKGCSNFERSQTNYKLQKLRLSRYASL